MNSIKKFLQAIANMDKKKKAYLIVGLIIFSVLMWAFITAAVLTCNFDRSQVKQGANKQKVDAVGLIITETKEGKKYFEIYGETGSYNNEQNIATLHNVIGNFYKDEDVSMSFQSSKGEYDEKRGTITLFKNTYIVLKDNTSLSADKLVWAGSDNDIIAEINVKIKKTDDMIALADKCIISPNFDKFKIIGKTKTKIFGKEK